MLFNIDTQTADIFSRHQCWQVILKQSRMCADISLVLYYSNDILSKALPDLGPYISLLITVVNMVMTFPPIFLIERMGRKSLFNISSVGAATTLVLVGYGLNSGMVTLSSIAILLFITWVEWF